jgi:hypothetical protein
VQPLVQTSKEAGTVQLARQPNQAGHNWGRTIFSFPAVCLLLLAVVVLAVSAKDIAEPDVWWHMQNARHLLDTHHFPSTDTYSFTAAGSPWLDHEWLSEIPFYLGFQAAGLRGMLLVYSWVLLLTFVGVYYRCCLAGATAVNAAVATLGAIMLGEVSFGPRMLLFGWLCMVGLLIVLDRFRETGRGLWMLPPLFAIWNNLHGSWIFGIVVLLITIAGGLIQGEWGRVVARRWTHSELRKLLLALAAAVAALFVNPFGHRLVLYPFDLLFRQKTNMQHIDEWQSVNFQIGTGKLALLAIVALLAVALVSRRKWRLDNVALTAFALWASLTHVRLLFFLGLIVVPILAPSLKLFSSPDPATDRPRLNAFLMACIIAGLMIWFPSESKLQAKVDKMFPTAALNWMQRQHIQGRIFNNYNFGGYMIWKTPQYKTFIDGRADLFVYNGVFDEHLHAIQLEKSFEVLDKYRIDYALLEPTQALVYLLQHSYGWKTIYSDSTAVLLQRVQPPNSGPASSQ